MYTCRSRRGWETHPEVRVGFGDPPGGTGGPLEGPGGFECPTQRLGRGQEAHSKVRERSGRLPEEREGLGCPPGDLEVVGRPTQRSDRGQEAHLEVLEESGVPTGGLGGVERPMQRARRSRVAHPEVREGAGHLPRSLGVVKMPTQRSGRSREAHPEVREFHS